MSSKQSIHPVGYGWKLPFNLALLFHILIIAAALILPKYLQKKVVLPEFLTVDLINIAAPLPQPAIQATPPPPAAAKTTVTIHKLKPVASRITAPIAPAVSESEKNIAAPAPVKAISIKPLKRKIKKILPPDTSARDRRMKEEAAQKRQQLVRDLQKQQAQEQRRQQLLAEAQRQKKLADAELAAANEAVNALKNSLQADAAAASTAITPQSSPARQGGGSKNIIESQYQSSIFSSLQEHWALPDIKPWNPDLTAVVVIHIAKNGRIIQHRFEKRSGDRVFDQFVSRTIQEANPLPAIPAALPADLLEKNEYRIGLRFKPGQIL